MENMEISAEKTFLGHPRGLFTLFFTEMWERFSYYGMRALLTLYMIEYLFQSTQVGKVWGYTGIKGFIEGIYGPLSPQALSSEIYGLYTAFVYLTPIFGGLLADRFLGQRRSVYIGGVLMSIGHFLMAVESMFFPALIFLILGNGFFKPNISTQVGGLYKQGDSRRDSAFIIFYMGINLGAVLSPLICGTLGQKVGWHWGFGAAGVGMLLSLAIYHFGGKHLPQTEHPKALKQIEKEAHVPLTQKEWGCVLALAILCVINIFFWGVFEQQGNTLQLWAEQKTDWNFFGFMVPSTWYQSFNPLFIFILGPILSMFWGWQNRRGKEPSTVVKMGMGCFMACAALLIMFMAAKIVGPGQGSVLWLTMSTLVLTIGELYLSPTGLSLVTKIAPARIVSLMMGVWLLSSFFGNYLSGHIGTYYNIMSKESFFLLLAGMGLTAGVLFVLTRPFLRKLIGSEA